MLTAKTKRVITSVETEGQKIAHDVKSRRIKLNDAWVAYQQVCRTRTDALMKWRMAAAGARSGSGGDQGGAGTSKGAASPSVTPKSGLPWKSLSGVLPTDPLLMFRQYDRELALTMQTLGQYRQRMTRLFVGTFPTSM